MGLVMTHPLTPFNWRDYTSCLKHAYATYIIPCIAKKSDKKSNLNLTFWFYYFLIKK
jgi:hypothetical protein